MCMFWFDFDLFTIFDISLFMFVCLLLLSYVTLHNIKRNKFMQIRKKSKPWIW